MDNPKSKHARKLSDEKWHAFSEEEIFRELQSSLDGLSQEEVERRKRFYGPNTLPSRKPPTLFSIILSQFLNPLIFILIAAAVASVLIGEAGDAIFILIVIAINSALGAYQEYNAEKSASSLLSLIKINARVRREGKESEIAAEELVPGDIVLLESGLKVPADLRLIEAKNLAMDESFLTGESLASTKNTELQDEDIPVADRRNMAFAGSTVTSGRGTGIAVATGSQTQVGLIAESVVQSERAKPPLIMRMEQFTRKISILIILMSFFLAIVLRSQGYDLSSIFFFVVALAVSAIPEGLPVALTVALSIATKRMARRNVIVRRLTAVEALGSCTVIASDKTGTLTVNQQTARAIILPDGSEYSISGEGYNGRGEVVESGNRTLGNKAREMLQKLAGAAILANEATLLGEEEGWKYRGDAMDVAFLALGYKLGLTPAEYRKERPPVWEIPYESENKYSAVKCRSGEKYLLATKGAVEVVLEFCDRMATKDAIVDLEKELIEKQAAKLASMGLRVLGVALRENGGGDEKENANSKVLQKMIFLGIVGFIDPLRPEAKESVEQCRQAGIKVIMITGDHPFTAKAIASELGLSENEEDVVTGQQLEEAGSPDSPAYEKLVLSTHVFARVTPAQKLEIVNVLIQSGEFVAVTGDGVNDTPALKAANIGVAMGSGTDAAKETGSMIIIDDRFSSIVSGVEEGRYAYDNVRKVIYLLISTGAAEILFFTAAIFSGMPLPLLPVQLLWLNLVTNGIQDVALAFEGGEPGTMKRKPRKPKESIFNSLMISQTLVSGFVVALIVFSLWIWLINVQGMNEFDSRNLILMLMVLLQNVHVFNCRSEYESAFRVPIRRNYILIFGVLGAQGIHLLSMYIPFMQEVLKVTPISFRQWLLLLAFSLIILLVMELFKIIRGKLSAANPE